MREDPDFPATMELKPEHRGGNAVKSFMWAYLNSPADSELLLRIGTSDDGDKIMVLVLTHPDMEDVIIGLDPVESTVMERLVKDAIVDRPFEAVVLGLPNLIMALRKGVERMEAGNG